MKKKEDRTVNKRGRGADWLVSVCENERTL